MVKQLNITLNPGPIEGIYTPGSVISGVLTVKTDKPKDYEQIVVCLLGQARVLWTTGDDKHRTTHSALEVYVNLQRTVWTRPHVASTHSFPAGTHTYPFEFNLPTNCPSSFNSPVGKIIYSVVGEVTNKRFKLNHKIAHLLEVKEVVSPLGFPVGLTRFENRKVVGIGLFKSGVISYNVQLPSTNFSLGEDIPVSWYVENGSGRRITLQCSLVEKVTCYASDGATSVRKNTIIKQTGVRVPPHTVSGEVTIHVPIPLGCRLAVTRCRIIKSEIRLVATVKIPWAINSSIKIPVNIGNVQLQR